MTIMKVEHQISIVVLLTIILVVVICKNSETNTLCVRNTHVGAAVGDGTSHKVSSPEYIYSPKIFGHVHIAKTGGSNLVAFMANKFERICGNKGYSYDAYQDNERAKLKTTSNETVTAKNIRGDSIQVAKGYRTIVKEIGYEDCDYISFEDKWDFWNKTFPNGQLHGVPIELHVPCRDPIDHIMSQCNHRSFNFDCTATDKKLLIQMKKCLVRLDRFSMKLIDNFAVRCYDFRTQFTNYTHHMSNVLQMKRFTSTPFMKRSTNQQRVKNSECIWERPDIQKMVSEYLLTHTDYYQFCDSCIGTKSEITYDD